MNEAILLPPGCHDDPEERGSRGQGTGQHGTTPTGPNLPKRLNFRCKSAACHGLRRSATGWFNSRWRHSLYPAVSPLYVSGSKGLATTVADSFRSQLDLQLCDLRAERGPGEGCVHRDDVSPGPVAHRFEEIAACAVDLSERDEPAAKVMAATLAQPERSEIIVQLLRRLLRGPLGEVARRNDEIDRGQR